MTIRAVFCAALLAGAATAVAAQTPPPPMPMVRESAPNSPEALSPGYAERLALGRQLVAMLHTDTLMRGVLRQALASAVPNVGGSEDRQKARLMQEGFAAGMEQVMSRVTDDMPTIYARTFTTEEMRAAVAFYSSPDGQAFITKLPEMTRQMLPMMARHYPELFATMERYYCAKKTCTEAERTAFAAMLARAAAMAPGPAAR